MLTPSLILGIITLYFLVLIGISWWTSRTADNQSFFSANQNASWVMVAFGMIGASLSGVTFISVPGMVADTQFAYMQMVFGYLLGYLFIALVLMPLYYRLQLTSIYEYLQQRFGNYAYRIGAFYFILSRVLGASFRLLLVAIVLQKFVLGPMGIPMPLTVVVTIGLIWVYTFTGGIKTIIVTDTLQTVFMLLAVILTIHHIMQSLDLSGVSAMMQKIHESSFGQLWFFEGGWSDVNNFWKQFVSGALITIVMTGLDQDMMQKNLTCPNIKDAQKNVFLFSGILVVANWLFVSLGALLYIYANEKGIVLPERTDQVFPTLAFEHFPTWVGIAFILGLIAAAYSSADSALTALTTSFCIDFLNFKKRTDWDEAYKKKIRLRVHIAFSVLLMIIIIGFNAINKEAILKNLFIMAGYTYGPLLGLFVFGMLTKRKIKDKWSLQVCLVAPLLSYIIDTNSAVWMGGFQFGFLIIALNGLLTFIGLWIISIEAKTS